MMNIYKNDPKYKPLYKRALCQKSTIICMLDLSKFARATKTQNHTFWKFYKFNLKWSKVSL